MKKKVADEKHDLSLSKAKKDLSNNQILDEETNKYDSLGKTQNKEILQSPIKTNNKYMGTEKKKTKLKGIMNTTHLKNKNNNILIEDDINYETFGNYNVGLERSQTTKNLYKAKHNNSKNKYKYIRSHPGVFHQFKFEKDERKIWSCCANEDQNSVVIIFIV